MATKQLTARISVEVLDWVRERARQENRSVSRQVEWLLKQAMAECEFEMPVIKGPSTGTDKIWEGPYGPSVVSGFSSGGKDK